jgi:hypothetical protein
VVVLIEWILEPTMQQAGDSMPTRGVPVRSREILQARASPLDVGMPAVAEQACDVASTDANIKIISKLDL